MKQILAILHDILFQLSSEPILQNAISLLCESYYNKDKPDKELIIPQLLPYLLLRCLDDSGNVSLIKRLYIYIYIKYYIYIYRYAVRDGFYLLDFDDESIESLKELCLHCVIHPLFIKTNDVYIIIIYYYIYIG